jgi:hypothetical protein
MCTACSLWPHEEDWPIVHPFLERAAQRLGELRDQPVATDEVAFVVWFNNNNGVNLALPLTDADRTANNIIESLSDV